MHEQEKGTGQRQSGRASPDCDGVFRHINKLQMRALAKTPGTQRKMNETALFHGKKHISTLRLCAFAPLREKKTLNLKQIKPPTSRDEDVSRNLTGDTKRFT
jgi:hypothetical protein